MALTGYRIDEYMDVNPQSSTFQQTKTERVKDSDCEVNSAPDWQVTDSYCETDDEGNNTGWYVTTQTDINDLSPTYGETKESRVMNTTECPLPSKDPEWEYDLDDAYCEIKHYPKSGLDADSGKLIVLATDTNLNSPTYGQTKEISFTIEDWTDEAVEEYGEFPCHPMDETPQINPIMENCQLIECPDDEGNVTMVTNGLKDIFGIDSNPYSDTYLESTSAVTEDNVKCPNLCGDEYIAEFNENNSSALTINFNECSLDELINIPMNVYKISRKDGTKTLVNPSEITSVTFTVPPSWLYMNRTQNVFHARLLELNTTSSIRTFKCSITLYVSTDKVWTDNIILTVNARTCTVEPQYVFTYRDGNDEGITAKTSNIFNYSQDYIIYVNSTKDGGEIGYTVNNLTSWITYTKGDTIPSYGSMLTFHITANQGGERSQTIQLTQNNSGKICIITFSQAAATPVEPEYSDYVLLLSDGVSTATTMTFDCCKKTLEKNEGMYLYGIGDRGLKYPIDGNRIKTYVTSASANWAEVTPHITTNPYVTARMIDENPSTTARETFVEFSANIDSLSGPSTNKVRINVVQEGKQADIKKVYIQGQTPVEWNANSYKISGWTEMADGTTNCDHITFSKAGTGTIEDAYAVDSVVDGKAVKTVYLKPNEGTVERKQPWIASDDRNPSITATTEIVQHAKTPEPVPEYKYYYICAINANQNELLPLSETKRIDWSAYNVADFTFQSFRKNNSDTYSCSNGDTFSPNVNINTIRVNQFTASNTPQEIGYDLFMVIENSRVVTYSSNGFRLEVRANGLSLVSRGSETTMRRSIEIIYPIQIQSDITKDFHISLYV